MGDLTTLDVIGLSVSITGVLLGFVSWFFAFLIFVSTQKNYYQKFLKFIDKKEKKILRISNRRKIKSDNYVDILMEDVRFFAEDFFVNFTSDGYLKYHQYATIKGIYRHIRKRLIISRKVYYKAIKRGHQTIILRVQLFGKYNHINETHFQNKLKYPQYKKENVNIYVTLILTYNYKTRSFELQKTSKPSSLYRMGSDQEFKKNIYYIFSNAYKIDEKLDSDNAEKSYFFIACSYHDDKKETKANDTTLTKKEKMQESLAK